MNAHAVAGPAPGPPTPPPPGLRKCWSSSVLSPEPWGGSHCSEGHGLWHQARDRQHGLPCPQESLTHVRPACPWGSAHCGLGGLGAHWPWTAVPMGCSCWGVLLLSCVLHSQLSSQPSPKAASSARPHGTTSPQGVLPSWALMGVLPEPGHPKHLGREPILLGPVLGPTAGRRGRRVRWWGEQEPAVGCCGGAAAPQGSFLPSPGPRPSLHPHSVLGRPRASGEHLLPETLLGPCCKDGPCQVVERCWTLGQSRQGMTVTCPH